MEFYSITRNPNVKKKYEKTIKFFTRTSSHHTTPQTEDEVKSGLLLDVVIGESPAIFQLLPCENQPLLVWRNSFLVLDFRLDILNRIRWLHFQGYGLPSQRLHEDLHAASQPKDEVESRLLLDVVVRQGPAIFQLFPSKDQPLLVWRNSFLVLDFSLDVLNRIRGLHFQGDCLASQCLHEDLHPTSQPEDEVESGLLLDVVVRQGPAIFQLFPREDKPLLVWWNSLLVLDLGLDVFDRVRRLDFQGYGFSSQGLNENLHS